MLTRVLCAGGLGVQHDTVQNQQREALRSVGMKDVTAQAVSQDQVRVCVCASVCVCECVCVRERERECVCVCERERERD